MAVFKQLAGDMDLLEIHVQNPARYPYLLESVATNADTRFDLLFAFPQQTIRVAETSGNFLEMLDHAYGKPFSAQSKSSNQSGRSETDLPFLGGWFLFLDYELAREIEPVLQDFLTEKIVSSAFATRIPAALIRDHHTNSVWVVQEQENRQQLQKMEADFFAALKAKTGAESNIESGTESSIFSAFEMQEEEPQRFLDGVEKIKHYIHEGDVFQVNLSRQWSGKLQADTTPYQLYRQLRKTNPAPFAGLAVDAEKNRAIISSSPERLVEVDGDRIQTRPIAGTHPRGKTNEEDQQLSERLLAHPKEQSEHVMLIDLERNDLGRVCRPGTVEVDALMELESYAHVHHIVSNVRGKLRKGTTPGAVIHALFPGGTITGCPKVRCMEVIQELEQAPRGAYTGSMGYLSHHGRMDLNILIRTITQRNNQQNSEITLRAGAGIVYDSVPQRELEETRAKARGMLLALQT